MSVRSFGSADNEMWFGFVTRLFESASLLAFCFRVRCVLEFSWLSNGSCFLILGFVFVLLIIVIFISAFFLFIYYLWLKRASHLLLIYSCFTSLSSFGPSGIISNVIHLFYFTFSFLFLRSHSFIPLSLYLLSFSFSWWKNRIFFCIFPFPYCHRFIPFLLCFCCCCCCCIKYHARVFSVLVLYFHFYFPLLFSS